MINALREFGVAEKDNFDTSDLFDRKNARQVSPHLLVANVQSCMHARVGRKCARTGNEMCMSISDMHGSSCMRAL